MKGNIRGTGAIRRLHASQRLNMSLDGSHL